MRFRLLLAVFPVLASLPLACLAASSPARVAFLGGGAPTTPIAREVWRAFTESMQSLGWIEGKNVTFILRYSEGRADRAAALASELVFENPDVIVAASYPSARAVQQSTKTIPIVFVNVPDPVRLGLVESIPRPGGNITGISDQTQDLVGKALQLLKETRPSISRMAYLGYGESAYWKGTVETVTAAAQELGVAMSLIPIKSPADFDAAFGEIMGARADALAVSGLPIFQKAGRQIANFAIEHRLPTLSFVPQMARDGLLLALSADITGAYRPAAAIVDKILKGAKPADIPVEQPTRFHFVVNLKTAHAIGIEIPPVMLSAADEVIE